MSSSSAVTGLRLREQDLCDKVAAVTGASRGIGRAIALNLASRGCSILATCSCRESLHHISTLSHSITDIYNGTPQGLPAPKVIGIDANILDPDTPTKIADAVQREFGSHLDIFVNNACIASVGKIGELTDEHIHGYLRGNVEVPVKIVDEFVKRQPFRPNSRIIHISSVLARKAWADQLMYMATNSTAEALVRGWPDAFGGESPQYAFMTGTTANTVMPGITRTDALYSNHLPQELISTFEDEFVPSQSIPRVGDPEDIADVVGLLCREESRWITGRVIGADGGGMSIL